MPVSPTAAPGEVDAGAVALIVTSTRFAFVGMSELVHALWKVTAAAGRAPTASAASAASGPTMRAAMPAGIREDVICDLSDLASTSLLEALRDALYRKWVPGRH